ncbi:uroporphyrinogen-III C-methyltransferase [Microbacterium paludicola]|uniref:Uroporphyrinogen-III C-methyltransferase n=1 Tax=Microbacterium paludicola TaxID=300019 RepID=A0A4Y9FYV7_9MICO|nr:uroporphyrinogen-III C-methyltransferase [Microbacterium paludicola]MBF0814872.1 uroporphyrinogen-III C-methyltransferase [Microbacterium paludicola]TFU34609.1 uroporphyrinogen-III C-methyltransferase [Microbacterium paludicola]
MTTMLGVSLAGRDVLFVGGGSVAARRIPRLIEEGAVIRIVAPALGAETTELVEQHGLTWIARSVREEDVSAAWLVHTATGDPRIDADVAAWCESARTFCVNASDGAHGSARLTAETRSGDVVVAVSSDAGVDPRRAARVRNAIAALLDRGALPVRRVRESARGRVALVGGGPGPVDLMTVRARRLIAEADVVIADRLGPVDVLAELDPDVEVVDVGKRPGHHPVPQHEINALIVAHAQAGRRVVRLKGGDPFVFGRGGEEVTACLEAGVPVEVVPGPTSAVSVPQAAGIPVTHRGVSGAMHMVNGQGDLTPATLAALADDAVTTVVLMGVAGLARIVDAALDAGAPASRPVAIVESGHTPQQRTTHTTLATAVADARSVGIRNPAVIVIGEVARLDLLLPVPAAEAAAAG